MTNVDRIKALYAAFGRGDVSAIVEMTAEDVDWGLASDAPGIERLAWVRAGEGRAAVLGYFRGVGETMDVHAFEPVLVLGEGDSVLALIDIDFTVRPTGKRLRSREAMHFTFDRSGRIARYRPLFDTAERVAAYS